jgi:hypothetical protein
MSLYAYLTCPETRQMIFLGKAVWTTGDDSRQVSYFHLGPRETAPNSQQEELSRAVWRFLADHAGKELRVLLENELKDEGEYVVIGGDSKDDIPFDEYLKDWPG